MNTISLFPDAHALSRPRRPQPGGARLRVLPLASTTETVREGTALPVLLDAGREGLVHAVLASCGAAGIVLAFVHALSGPWPV